MDKLTLKVHKWQSGSGYKYTDIIINDRVLFSIIQTNTVNEFAVFNGSVWLEQRLSTYAQALQIVSKLIIEYLRGQST